MDKNLPISNHTEFYQGGDIVYLAFTYCFKFGFEIYLPMLICILNKF